MKVQSWLAPCSAGTNISSPRQSLRDVTNSITPSSSSSYTSSSSLRSDLSLQTLPSIPSLQNLSADHLKLAVSHLCISSLNPNPNQPITCLAVHGNLLYCASGHQINVYDTLNHTHLDSFNGQDSSSGFVKSLSFCNNKLITAHQDCKIRVWKITALKRHKLLTTLPTVNDRLRRFILPKNYVNVRRHKKRLWIEHADAVTSLAVNNGFIYSVSWDKCLKIWRASDNRCIESVTAHEDAVNTVTVSHDGTVYTGSADMVIRVWGKPLPYGTKRHTLIATLQKHKSAVNALALNDDGSVLFSGACDRSILVWEREDTAKYMVVAGALRGHSKAILCLINVSSLLLSGSADRTVRMWKRGYEGKYCCLGVLDGHERPVKSLIAVPDVDSDDFVSVFSGSLDGQIKIWRLSFSNLNSPAAAL